ncbi:hypothetical protein C4D60_Mb01t08230 [Musa balbisiana]|uniref:Uncharacterized protein n=1 Tax=Musa balbisiana TaxID=52838 RepID=A0A4S8JN55_MUSBA|nr:hypothetical protein C4D60_Mb01t08230 [Musa balbisiana]
MIVGRVGRARPDPSDDQVLLDQTEAGDPHDSSVCVTLKKSLRSRLDVRHMPRKRTIDFGQPTSLSHPEKHSDWVDSSRMYVHKKQANGS